MMHGSKFAVAGASALALIIGSVAIAQETGDTSSIEAVQKAEDGRQILFMTPEQRMHVRSQMRDFLAGVQGITEAIAFEDRDAIADIASGLGPHGGMGGGEGKGHGPGHGKGHGQDNGERHGQGMGQKMGPKMGQGGGNGMMRNMPAEFFEFGRPLHQNFAKIAEMAPTADMVDIQKALADNMNNCLGCHNTFTARDKK